MLMIQRPFIPVDALTDGVFQPLPAVPPVTTEAVARIACHNHLCANEAGRLKARLETSCGLIAASPG